MPMMYTSFEPYVVSIAGNNGQSFDPVGLGLRLELGLLGIGWLGWIYQSAQKRIIRTQSAQKRIIRTQSAQKRIIRTQSVKVRIGVIGDRVVRLDLRVRF